MLVEAFLAKRGEAELLLMKLRLPNV